MATSLKLRHLILLLEMVKGSTTSRKKTHTLWTSPRAAMTRACSSPTSASPYGLYSSIYSLSWYRSLSGAFFATRSERDFRGTCSGTACSVCTSVLTLSFSYLHPSTFSRSIGTIILPRSSTPTYWLWLSLSSLLPFQPSYWSFCASKHPNGKLLRSRQDSALCSLGPGSTLPKILSGPSLSFQWYYLCEGSSVWPAYSCLVTTCIVR